MVIVVESMLFLRDTGEIKRKEAAPGHALIVDVDGDILKNHHYWKRRNARQSNIAIGSPEKKRSMIKQR